MKGTLFLAFLIGFPILEIYTTWQVGEYIGFWYTFFWIILAVFLGVFLIKAEKTEFAWRIFDAVREQRSFKYVLLDSGLSIVAGILFALPGILTDILALILLIMPSEWITSDEKSKKPTDQTIDMNQENYSAHFESDQQKNNVSPSKQILIEGEYKKDETSAK